ncbi:MAG: hypothetical protein K2J11_03815 [Oscillospiraceae bacterium]|nr:hypothetical protein [Oscillospiraceae bacterium]
MNITGTTNRTPVITTRSKSSSAQAAETLGQSNFEDALQKSLAAKYSKDAFTGTSDVKRTPTRTVSSSIPDTQAKLDSISEAIKNTDYSGMSKAEIYVDIEKKYADIFDDFYMTMAVETCKDHNMIHLQFLDDIKNAGCDKITLSDKLEARGYSNMDYNEIEAAIKEKYAGKTGFVDQLNLFGELYSAGVIINKFGWEAATDMASHLSLSLQCGYDGRISKSEWLSVIEETGISSPFTFLINNPYFAKESELYKLMADDILFGIADRAK